MSEHRDEHKASFDMTPPSNGWTVGVSSRGKHSGDERSESTSDALRPGTGKHRRPKFPRWSYRPM